MSFCSVSGAEKRKSGAEKRKSGAEKRKSGAEKRKSGAEKRKSGAEKRNCTLGPPYPRPFFGGGPPHFIKREKAVRACVRKRRVLVLNTNSYPDPPFAKSCIRR